jgi:hypothetical protein
MPNEARIDGKGPLDQSPEQHVGGCDGADVYRSAPAGSTPPSFEVATVKAAQRNAGPIMSLTDPPWCDIPVSLCEASS